MNIEQIADAVVANAKTGKWLNCTFELEGPGYFGHPVRVGIKAYGKWVQRIECCGLVDGVLEQKTLKALKAEVVAALTNMTSKL